jgi:hypothetical protein
MHRCRYNRARLHFIHNTNTSSFTEQVFNKTDTRIGFVSLIPFAKQVAYTRHAQTARGYDTEGL